eukprot:g12624.t1
MSSLSAAAQRKGDATSTIGELGSCSYLVIGAGAPALAFIDTLLTLNHDGKISKDAPIVLVDRHDAPGGHWNDAYDYVRLHQPSLMYGVSSKQLEGNWFTNNLLKFRLPWNHRASKQEILAYYAEVVATWEKEGLVKFFGRVEFDFEKAKRILDQAQGGADVEARTFEFARLEDDGRPPRSGSARRLRVSVTQKLVDATAGECIVPSAKNMPFRVEEASGAKTRIQVCVPSELHTLPESEFQTKRFCVLGGGKTGMDALVWLQREKGVKPEHISWVVGRETWMLSREKLVTLFPVCRTLPETVLDAMSKCGAEETGYLETAWNELESKGVLRMIDETGAHRPTDFRGPMIDSEELSYLRKPELTKYRQGYVAKLELFINLASTKDDGGANKGDVEESVRIHFKEMNKRKHQAKISDEESVVDVVTVGKAEEVVFIHCTAPGPFNDRMPHPLYQGSHQMNLMYIFPPPVPQSASTLAWIETGRRLNAAYGGEHGALRESVEKILGGERGAAMNIKIDEKMCPEESLAKLIRPGLGPPENFAHMWNMGVLNCLDFVNTCPRRAASPARSGYPLPPGFDKFPSYQTFLDGNRLFPQIRRQHLETMEELEACMRKRKSAMISEKNGVDGERDLGAVRSMVEIMKEKGLRGK